ncbi:MAG: hypothetical protein ABRQ37_17605 [Candidatus Eremiobacterota bacterium]
MQINSIDRHRAIKGLNEQHMPLEKFFFYYGKEKLFPQLTPDNSRTCYITDELMFAEEQAEVRPMAGQYKIISENISGIY